MTRPRQLVKSWEHSETDSEQAGPGWSGTLCPSQNIKTFKDHPEMKKKKKQKNLKFNGNKVFDEIANIAWLMQYQPLAREFSGIIKETLEAAWFVGCNADGCHPGDITDDTGGGVVEYPVIKTTEKNSFIKGHW